jgi:type IV pilus assembly protein PilM
MGDYGYRGDYEPSDGPTDEPASEPPVPEEHSETDTETPSDKVSQGHEASYASTPEQLEPEPPRYVEPEPVSEYAAPEPAGEYVVPEHAFEHVAPERVFEYGTPESTQFSAPEPVSEYGTPESTQFSAPDPVSEYAAPEPAAEVAEPELAAAQVEPGAVAPPEQSADTISAEPILDPGSSETHEPDTSSDPRPAGPSEPERRRRLALRRERAPKPEKRKREKAGAKDKRVKKLVGLKIGASQIAAARVHNNGAPALVEAVREPLEPGIVVSGEIRDAEALSVALQRFFDRHKLPKKGVRLGVSNNRIGVRVFEIEGVTEQQQLENAIRFRAEEVLPIPLDQAVLDYVVLDEGERPDGTAFRRILLVVAYREVVERYLEACRGAGIEVVGIDLEAFALLRSLAAPVDRDQSTGALVAVAVGHDRTTIAVSTGRTCEFTRVLDWGGWSLNVAVARELDLAPSEVEAIKRQLSFAEETEVEGLAPEKVAKTRDGVQRALAAFARELVASLHFYQAQPGALGIGEIVVTGGTAHMPGFPDALGRLIGVPVRLGDPLARVTTEGQLDDTAQTGSLAVAIGLGIED